MEAKNDTCRVFHLVFRICGILPCRFLFLQEITFSDKGLLENPQRLNASKFLRRSVALERAFYDFTKKVDLSWVLC